MIFKFFPLQILNDFSSCSLNFQAPSNSSLCGLLAHLMSLYIFHPIFQSRFPFGTFLLPVQFFKQCFLQMQLCGGQRGRLLLFFLFALFSIDSLAKCSPVVLEVFSIPVILWLPWHYMQMYQSLILINIFTLNQDNNISISEVNKFNILQSLTSFMLMLLF